MFVSSFMKPSASLKYLETNSSLNLIFFQIAGPGSSLILKFFKYLKLMCVLQKSNASPTLVQTSHHCKIWCKILTWTWNQSVGDNWRPRSSTFVFGSIFILQSNYLPMLLAGFGFNYGMKKIWRNFLTN